MGWAGSRRGGSGYTGPARHLSRSVACISMQRFRQRSLDSESTLINSKHSRSLLKVDPHLYGDLLARRARGGRGGEKWSAPKTYFPAGKGHCPPQGIGLYRTLCSIDGRFFFKLQWTCYLAQWPGPLYTTGSSFLRFAVTPGAAERGGNTGITCTQPGPARVLDTVLLPPKSEPVQERH